MRISDWSSDVCSSDLERQRVPCPAAAVDRAMDAVDARERDPAEDEGRDAPREVEALGHAAGSSEERRVGKAWVSTCSLWRSPYPYKKNTLLYMFLISYKHIHS